MCNQPASWLALRFVSFHFTHTLAVKRIGANASSEWSYEMCIVVRNSAWRLRPPGMHDLSRFAVRYFNQIPVRVADVNRQDRAGRAGPTHGTFDDRHTGIV